MATPCSVNTNGGLRKPIFSRLDITFCDIQFPNEHFPFFSKPHAAFSFHLLASLNTHQ